MNLATAARYAELIVDGWIYSLSEQFRVAGSIRRQRSVCNDVDIVCIPRYSETKDLFGAITSRENLLHSFLKRYVAESGGRASFQSGGEVAGKSVILQLPKCQIDIWFADEATFATRLMCRTGSKEHNIWLASWAKRQGKKWNPSEGILEGGEWRKIGEESIYDGAKKTSRFKSEEDIYAHLGLPFIEPKDRELDWLTKNFGIPTWE